MTDKKWWKEAVGYQIYPKSFYDSNGDGIGDLQGIIQKLDYLADLGVNLLWLCPIYRSPMDDNGYDISDYFQISPEFGTLEDFKELLAAAKARGMRLIMDLVLNHTSDEHPWFLDAISSKDSPYRDFYIWRPGKNGAEPTNWASFFTDSCWTKDEASGEYYMHIFSKKMPDLNWANPKMRSEYYKMARWWLDLGIDGFRIDAVSHLDRDLTFTDSTLEGHGPYREDWQKFSNLPKVHDYLKEMRREVFSDYDLVTVGEVGGDAGVPEALKYAAPGEQELDMVFTFDHCWHNHGWNALEWWWENKTDLYWLKQVFQKWQTGLYGRAWTPLYWHNHDHPRVMSQYGDAINFHKESGKMLATVLLMMWGTPFIYNGEEIGMTNPYYYDFSEFKDPSTVKKIKRLLAEGHPEHLVRRYTQTTARDNARTPMQWNSSEFGGFSTVTPWMKPCDNYQKINVAANQKDDSILSHYKKLIKLRKEGEYKDVIVYGDFTLIHPDHGEVYAFMRKYESRQLLVVCNFFGRQTQVEFPGLNAINILAANYAHPKSELSKLVLRPFEALVYEVEEA